jgi:hypothetical protein
VRSAHHRSDEGPARIVDDIMAIPGSRLRYLTPADLADWVVLTAN